jgi:hypothetical protein
MDSGRPDSKLRRTRPELEPSHPGTRGAPGGRLSLNSWGVHTTQEADAMVSALGNAGFTSATWEGEGTTFILQATK